PPRSSATSAPARRCRCAGSRRGCWATEVRLPRYRSGDVEIDAAIAAIAEQVAEPGNTDLVFELMASAVRLAVDHAYGGALKLPFEATTSQFVDGDPKLVNFRYFFTRKLEFIKESDAFVLLPGGFGTLDEAFELLTLLQTGKAQPSPVVMLDVPG